MNSCNTTFSANSDVGYADQLPDTPTSIATSHTPLSRNSNVHDLVDQVDENHLSKRTRISIACDNCRRKKVKCNGEHPCEYCKRSNYTCTYRASKRRGASAGFGRPRSELDSSEPIDSDTLAEMMTFMVSLEENGGIHAFRSLGSSSGMHLLRLWHNKSPEGVFVVPRITTKQPPSGPETELPSPQVINILLDFYFEYSHPFLPILEKDLVYSSLHQPKPPLLLLNAIFAVSARVYDSLSTDDTAQIIASEVFISRARQLARDILVEPPCLEYMQALLILTFHELGILRGPTWTLSGLAIRMAQDIGLNRKLDHIHGMTIAPLQQHLMKKTWAAVLVIDRLICASLGRPLAIHDEDCDADWPDPAHELIPNDTNSKGVEVVSDFTQLGKLCLILGKVLRNLNSVRNCTPGRLAYSLPEIHTELSQWLNFLPPRLRYSFSTEVSPPSSCAAFLNAIYYTTIILLYRPFITSPNAKQSPLFPQYLHICSNAAQAIVHICYHRADTLFLLPNFIIYCIFNAISTLAITYLTSRPPNPNDKHDPRSQHFFGLQSPNHANHLSNSECCLNSLSGLAKLLSVLATLQEVWPIANRLGSTIEEFFIQNNISLPGPRACQQMKSFRQFPSQAVCNDPVAVSNACSKLLTFASNSANLTQTMTPSLSKSCIPLPSFFHSNTISSHHSPNVEPSIQTPLSPFGVSNGITLNKIPFKQNKSQTISNEIGYSASKPGDSAEPSTWISVPPQSKHWNSQRHSVDGTNDGRSNDGIYSAQNGMYLATPEMFRQDGLSVDYAAAPAILSVQSSLASLQASTTSEYASKYDAPMQSPIITSTPCFCSSQLKGPSASNDQPHLALYNKGPSASSTAQTNFPNDQVPHNGLYNEGSSATSTAQTNFSRNPSDNLGINMDYSSLNAMNDIDIEKAFYTHSFPGIDPSAAFAAPTAMPMPFGILDMEQMMGVSQTMEFGGLGLDLDTFAFGTDARKAHVGNYGTNAS